MTNLLKELLSWEGTPYMRGQRVKRTAVDCVNFLAGVLDALYKSVPLPVLKMPLDIGIHSKRDSWIMNRRLIEAYPHISVRNNDVEPGDVILAKRGLGPGHVLIVGPELNTVWHASSGGGVVKTGIAQIGQVVRVWRLLEKIKWQIP